MIDFYEAQKIALEILKEQKKDWEDYVIEENRLLNVFEDGDD